MPSFNSRIGLPAIEPDVSSNSTQGHRGSGLSAKLSLPKGTCSNEIYSSTINNYFKKLAAILIKVLFVGETANFTMGCTWPNKSQENNHFTLKINCKHQIKGLDKNKYCHQPSHYGYMPRLFLAQQHRKKAP
jgi:hypothetical protein